MEWLKRFRWQKGQSGNPGGRHKKDVSSIAQAVFEKNEDTNYRAMLKGLKRRNPKMFAVLADRAFGNPGGRPERDLAAEIARAIFDKNPELLGKHLKLFTERVEVRALEGLAEQLAAARKRAAVIG